MTTDNRTNEPTEAQVEAAAKATHESNKKFYPGMWQVAWELQDPRDVEGYLDGARAALVAAQGAAPQAVWEIGDPYTCADLGHEDCDGSHRDHRAPVLPSSGVDEDALAEVIGRDENYTRDIGFGGWTLSPRLAARAVAEWLKGQGNAARE